jgi:hypothetical protein
MKKSWIVLVAVLAVGALGVGACSSDSDSKSSDTTTTTKAKAAKPSATADPTTGLAEGQEVTVKVKDFKAGLTLGINECAQAGEAEVGEGDCNLSGIKTIDVGTDGTGTGTIPVTKGPIGENAHMCGTPDVRCFLSIGELTADPNAQRTDDIDLTFAA